MQGNFLSSRLTLDQRSARIEQLLDRGTQLLASVPLQTWKFLVTLLLIVWVSYSLARLFWLILPEPQLPSASVTLAAPTAPVDSGAPSVDVESLKSSHIFGQAQQVALEEPTEAPAIETETVDTQLNLVLMGAIASSDESSGRAIIAANGQQEVYAPGAELPVGKNVTLAKVMDQRVILNNNGRYESLWLHQEEGVQGNRNRARPTQARTYTPEPVNRGWSDEVEEGSPYDTSSGPIPFDPPREVEVDADPTAQISRSISDVVAMSIHREGGQVVGYRIRPGRNAEQFTALGLQPDDIVTAVNGVPLNNPGKIMEIYKNMANASSASLEIKRGGSVLSIDIVLQ